MSTFHLLAGTTLVLGFLSGCGGHPAGRVTGKVTLQGQPVTSGEVHFYSKEKGVGAIARIDRTGSYALPEPLEAGTYVVSILPAPPEPVAPGSSMPPVVETIPTRYRDPGTSGLSIPIKGGSNDVPIAMQE